MRWGHIGNVWLLFALIHGWTKCDASGLSTEETPARVDPSPELHPSILHHVLNTEPNNHIRILSNISDDPSYLKRTFLDAAHRQSALTLQRWMQDAGLSSWVDGLANVRGRVAGENETSPAILIGSHYDTVVDAGAYDGAMGIIVGIAAAKANILSAAVSAGIISNENILEAIKEGGKDAIDINTIFREHGQVPRLRRPVQVVAFSDEEGVRFQSTFLGSRGLVGDLFESYLNSVIDDDGVTLLKAIVDKGVAVSADDVMLVAAGRSELAGYVEVHIEQGPVLEVANEPLGVVTGIAGQTWGRVSVRGSQGHAGTVPMGVRRDPLPAAGAMVHALETLCVDKKSDSLVCTVGKMDVWPGASNVIPGAVNFTVDVRALSDELRTSVVEEFRRMVELECRQRHLDCEFEIRHETKAVAMDTRLTEALVHAVGKVGDKDLNDTKTCAASQGKEVIRMPSGAGHDAVAMSRLVPVSMLFVRCKGGISHRPDEFAHPDDIAAAALATYHFIRDWQDSNE